MNRFTFKSLQFTKLIISMTAAIALVGLEAGDASAKRAADGSKRGKYCAGEFNSDLMACTKLPNHMTQGLPQSVYDEAIRECENNAARDYDKCVTTRVISRFDHFGEGGNAQILGTEKPIRGCGSGGDC